MPEAKVGCSGFNYDSWKGNLSPEDLPRKRWLEHYATVFSTVELNVTFYRLPPAATFDRWHAGRALRNGIRDWTGRIR